MNRSLTSSLRLGIAGVAVFAFGQIGLTSSPAFAQAPPPAAAPPEAAPGAAPAAPPAAPTSPLTVPSMTGPLAAPVDPYHFDAAGLGTVYVTGAASGLLLYQGNSILGDKDTNIDLSNGMLMIQKIDGLVQFFVQVGGYSLPALGVNYHLTQRDGISLNDYFGGAPVAYAKIAPTDTFSIEGGKLPTLFGAEYTFTFQNMNIERGLLWSQEPAISRGVQANLTTGPLLWQLSVNDGLYSDRFNWVDGAVTWTIDPINSLEVVAGGNVGTTSFNTIASPFFQSNEDIFNVMYTYNNAPWTITPYFQYTSVPKNAALGATAGASTWGGAVLANYNIDANWNLSGRVEYITSSGSAAGGNANVLGFGPGSSAWSFTVTPTWQSGIWFTRLEGSYVGLSGITAPGGFGRSGSATSQGRFVLEGGVLF